MKKDQIIKALEAGDISIETIVDSYLLEKQRANTVYDLVSHLEITSARLESSLRLSEIRYNERVAFEKGVIEHILPNLRDLKWKNIIDYVEEYITAHKDNGESRYCIIDVNDISSIPPPGFRWNE